ncbi:MAG: DUF3866 family protein [Brachybacterium sp.]|nr:DUF3866 family protein [Brachybacterium sp.]
MMRWERATVEATLGGWTGVARLQVRSGEESLRALAYDHLTGCPEVGEQVLLNTNALRRGLGTGGDALVVARPDVDPQDLPAPTGEGHMVKLRYTPVQVMVDAVDDPASTHHAVMQRAEGIDGMPVVVADLHSSVPAIVAGVRADRPTARIAYVHTDGASLPAAYSRSIGALREHGLLEACISAGQAFGGDLEAVTLHSALLAARHVVEADVAVAVQGPGNLGSGTGWGFSGIEAAEALHAAAALGGRPVATLRVSDADPRPRHRGLSHHSATTYGRATFTPVILPVLGPTDARYSPFHARVWEQLEFAVVEPGVSRGVEHIVREVAAEGLDGALRSLPVRLSTMGRGLDEDPSAFLYAALAGRAAAEFLEP